MSKVDEGRVFYRNIVWTIDQITVQHGHALGVKTRARSGYYKAAFMFASSIAEALAHKALTKKLMKLEMKDIHKIGWECFESQPLNDKFSLSSEVKLAICKRRNPKFELKQQTDFKTVNEVAFKIGLYDKRLFAKMESIRTKRNKIHLQNLSKIERSWTSKELKAVSDVILKLFSILDSLS